MPRVDLVGAVLAALLLAAACGSDDDAEAGGESGGSPSPTPPTAEQRCPDGSGAGMDVVRFDAADTSLYGLATGSGPRGVVLIHGSGVGGVCHWTPEMPRIAEAGFNLLAYDRSCVGGSGCGERATGQGALAAADVLRDRGATSVVVVGISAGGDDALIAAARMQPNVDAAVALSLDSASGISGDTPPTTAEEAAPMLRVPVLYAVAEGDGAASVEQSTGLYEATTSTGSDLVVLPPGSGHGTRMLYPGPDATEVGGAFFGRFIDFLTAHSAS